MKVLIYETSVPLVTPYTTNSNQTASCAFVQDAFANNLLYYVTLNTNQTITRNKTLKRLTWVSGKDLRILDTASAQGIQIFNRNKSTNNTSIQGIYKSN